MFTKEHKNMDLKNVETIIGPSIKVKGNFHGQGNIVIEGIVEGSVKTSNHLLIGNKAKITANIEAKEAKVGGEVRGNVKVEGYLEIAQGAKINGDIEASSLSIAKGAIFNGRSTMGGHKEGHHESNKEHGKHN
jgi:cytoskeletal protein CcmA (bactofilin family)